MSEELTINLDLVAIAKKVQEGSVSYKTDENWKSENEKASEISKKIKELTGITPYINGCCLWVEDSRQDIHYYLHPSKRLNYLRAFELMYAKLQKKY